MQALVPFLLVILAVVIAMPVTVLCVEIVAGLLLRQPPIRTNPGARRRIAVIVPAHNESSAITPTLADIKAQLFPGDRLIVVADNCDDDTATIAEALGAEVVIRHDLKQIGKGYALDFGLRHLDKDPPDLVVTVDADCRIMAGAIDQLTSACWATGRPVQALYLMTMADESKINHQIAEFAWRVKNWVRPLGLAALHLPCQLMGAGMAFPWKLLHTANMASAWLVEDLKLGLELTAAGHPPLFCPAARVTSHFAQSARGADSQRRRWEHGHIVTILREAPRLLYLAMTRGNFSLLALTLDLTVPPLSLLTLLLLLTFMITGLAAVLGLGSAALIVSTCSLLAFAAVVILAWRKFGREVLPPSAIVSLPAYILRKLGLYRQVLFGKMTAHWIRTDRAKS